MRDITEILNAAREGKPQATEELIPLVYDELRQLAAHQLAREKPGHTLQATALVHEAYLRLVRSGGQEWENRRHFFGAAAEAMRRILTENARRKKRLKRGGSWTQEEPELEALPLPSPSEEMLALDEGLDELTAAHPKAAELVKLRFFVGLTLEQSAELLGICRRTADHLWAFARSWLYRRLRDKK